MGIEERISRRANQKKVQGNLSIKFNSEILNKVL